MHFVLPEFGTYQKTTRAERQEMARRQQAVRDAFNRHRDQLRQTAPAALHTIQDLDLSDGQTRYIVWEKTARRLHLSLRCGNGQTGYFDLNLHLTDIELSPRDRDILRLVVRHGNKADIKAWEADLAHAPGPNRPFLLRLQWNTLLPVRYENKSGPYRLPRHRPRYRFKGVMHPLEPEIELRFAALHYQIVPCPAHSGKTPKRQFVLLR